MRRSFRWLNAAASSLMLALTLASPASAQSTASIDGQEAGQTYSSEEILAAAHQFFGKTTRGVAQAIEHVFSSQGEPDAYIVGEEAAGAVIGGLRYGEGTVYFKNGARQRIYWQGPSVGFDLGGNGSRSLVLVYNSGSPGELHGNRFMGIEGSAYVVGGVGVNYQKYGDIILAPIRTGIGARLGANVGYLKYSRRPDWNPF